MSSLGEDILMKAGLTLFFQRFSSTWKLLAGSSCMVKASNRRMPSRLPKCVVAIGLSQLSKSISHSLR